MSLTLNDTPALRVELDILGYQFPDSRERWDANWLRIQGRIEHPQGAWSFEDACLTAFE
nr:hypothetical protein [Pseudomonas sp. Fl4BN1]